MPILQPWHECDANDNRSQRVVKVFAYACMYACIYIHTNVCMYVCVLSYLYVGVFVHMLVYLYICWCICTYVGVFVCLCVGVFVCFVCMEVHMYIWSHVQHIYGGMYIHMEVCTDIWMYIGPSHRIIKLKHKLIKKYKVHIRQAEKLSALNKPTYVCFFRIISVCSTNSDFVCCPTELSLSWITQAGRQESIEMSLSKLRRAILCVTNRREREKYVLLLNFWQRHSSAGEGLVLAWRPNSANQRPVHRT
jgi:hypothetical protein